MENFKQDVIQYFQPSEKELFYNFEKELIEKRKRFFKRQRILLWNYILQGLEIQSFSHTHAIIDSIEDILIDSDSAIAKSTLKELKKANKEPNRNMYKIKFVADSYRPLVLKGLSGQLLTSKNFQGRFGYGKKLARSVKNLAEKMNYDIEIISTYCITEESSDSCNAVVYLIEEKNIFIGI